ncbi:MAG TPA: hypothetical protein VGO60_02325 [Iamia sp.]|jgi:hypothetical protein|nr:hypothetical protein [Iamia sp.]
MDTTAASSRPSDRRLLIIVALAAALVGVLAGRWSPGGSPAGAVIDAWHEPVYSSPAWEEGFEALPPGYGVDDEQVTHLRGALVATDLEVERPNGTSGPWLAEAFTLPCGYRPTQIVLMEVGATDQGLSTPYRGMLNIEPDGSVMVGAWDVSVDPVEEPAIDIVVLLDGVTFEAAPDSPECVEEGPTTTTTEAETTTTTTEPEE